MYLIERDKEITEEIIRDVLIKFQTNDLPRLKKYKRYYDGNHDILKKEPTDIGKPCNKVVTNYCKYIADSYNGYLTGIPVQYDNYNL